MRWRTYRGVGKTRTPHVFSHGYRKAPPEKKTNTVPATIHSELAGCKMEKPKPFANLCEKHQSSVRVTVGILYQPDGTSQHGVSEGKHPREPLAPTHPRHPTAQPHTVFLGEDTHAFLGAPSGRLRAVKRAGTARVPGHNCTAFPPTQGFAQRSDCRCPWAVDCLRPELWHHRLPARTCRRTHPRPRSGCV
jgi:hypothetical protein